MHLNPYLFFSGQCEEALKFYAQVLGGRRLAEKKHAGTPAEPHVPPEWHGKVMHARMTIGDKVIMASDSPPGRQDAMKGFAVSLGLDTPEEAERVFKAFSEGGTVGMAMVPTFFAARFGMLVDRFGTPWMIICEKAP
ncbi:MAG: VOC family protein [Methylobacteriaceae bacterium]|nr:VOC family protein [Methylobacteriaceae bacterium]MBV9246611.1 VOC family protein [Methylobacteriaceae bacterium]